MRLATGLVGAYDPDAKLYVVQLDDHGSVRARRLATGIDKPFPVGSRVVCMTDGALDWVIFGELDAPRPRPAEARPQTVDEAAADLDGRLLALRENERVGQLPNYRTLGEEPQFVGDASLENRTADPRERSRLKVFSFGAVVAFASHLCFILLNRRDSDILVSARSWWKRLVGYNQKITVSTADPRTVVRETVEADVLCTEETEAHQKSRIDRETQEGYVPAPAYAKTPAELMEKPRVSRGRRDRFGTHRVEERDNRTSTYRTRQDVVEREGRDDETRTTEMTTAAGRIAGEGEGPARLGFRAQFRDWLRVEVDNETGALTVTDLRAGGRRRFTLQDEHVTLERGEQFFRLDDDGLHIKAKSVTIDAEGTMLMRSGDVHTIQTPRLDVTG